MGGFVSTFQCLGRNDLTDADRTRDPIENIEGIKPSLSQDIQSPRKSEDDGPENDLYSVSLTDTLNSFRLEKRFTDFIISVDGNHFSAHKNVLAASCEFFREMFNTSEKNCYEVENVEPKAVDEVLTFLYTGKCWMCEKNAASVLLLQVFWVCVIYKTLWKFIFHQRKVHIGMSMLVQKENYSYKVKTRF